MKSKTDRSLSFRSLQELRDLESKFKTTSTTLKITLAIITSLETIGRALRMSQHKTPKQDSTTFHCLNAEDDCKELRALAACSSKCKAYLASVEVMRSRVGRLVKLVILPVFHAAANIAPVDQSHSLPMASIRKARVRLLRLATRYST